ncbi:hypothetical protein BJV82DRAFT_485111, partial [Fennellomyces sp. T-0311]
STKSKVCLVALDYAGLSTDPIDIYDFVCQNQCVQYIAIDNLPSLAKVALFTKAEILDKPELLDAFDCR